MNAVPSWADGIRSLHEQTQAGGGLLELEVVRPVEMVGILGAAMAGDPKAGQVMTMLADTVKRISAASRTRKPALCGSCPRRLLNNKYSLVIAKPSCDGPMNAVVLAICRKCGTGHDEIQRQAVVALKRLWPDLRAITITPGGRA